MTGGHCGCGKAHDVYGVHATTCVNNGKRGRNAFQLESLMKHLMEQAGMIAVSTQFKVGHNPSNGKELRVDIRRESGRPYFYDTTTLNPLATSWRDVPDAMLKKETKKITKYEAACKDLGGSFVPLVTDIFGGCAPEMERTVKECARKWGTRMGLKPCVSYPNVFQRVSLTIAQGVASCLVGALDGEPHPEDYGTGHLEF